VPILAICAYLAIFQNYILFVERVCAGIEASLVLLESLFGVAAVASFSRFVFYECLNDLVRRGYRLVIQGCFLGSLFILD
jgi:hypothetical protein